MKVGWQTWRARVRGRCTNLHSNCRFLFSIDPDAVCKLCLSASAKRLKTSSPLYLYSVVSLIEDPIAHVVKRSDTFSYNL